jgi:programmed cell death protein 4
MYVSLLEIAGKGFERLFENIDDIALDVPDCRAVVAKFLARAVADEILPPAYLNDSYVNSLAGDVIVEAKVCAPTPCI